MKKCALLLVNILILSFIASCGPMDETYKEFIKDGPKMYLTRLAVDSLEVHNGWNRIMVSFPVIKDGRSTKVAISLNQSDTTRYELAKGKRTEVLINDMREGSVVFSAWLEDDEQNQSLTTDFTGTVYGVQYQNYLLNRPIVSKTMKSGNLIIKYSMLLDSVSVASRLTWNDNGVEKTKISFYNSDERDTLYNFTSTSFKMETLFVPEKGVLDSIWSKPITYNK